MNPIPLRFPEIRNRLRWQLAKAWAALGMLELFALALMALWFGLSWQVNLPLREETVLLSAKVQAQRLAHDAAAQSISAQKTGTDLSAGLMDFLPDDGQRERQLAKLHQLSDRYSLQLTRVDYRIETVDALSVQRASLRLNIQGGYAMQRKFIRALLEALPNLALERITLEKTAGIPDSMNTLLDASLYYRPTVRQDALQGAGL